VQTLIKIVVILIRPLFSYFCSMKLIKIVSFTQTENPELFEKALAIRTEVFVIGQNVPSDMEHDEFDKTATHYLLSIDGNTVGAARYREKNNKIKLERFAVLPQYRNEKLGQKILAKVLNDLKHSEKEIYCHAQIAALSFWSRNGFTSFGENFFEAGIEHIRMRFNSKKTTI